MSKPIKFALGILTFLGSSVAFQSQAQGQTTSLETYNQKRIQYNKDGMKILGGWALGNMALGAIQSSRTTGETKAFHQMNMYWNGVNLLIAGFGYYSAIKETPSSDAWETINAQHSIEKILLFNAGLDIAYMVGGIWLNERGDRLSDSQLMGFGKSVMLQGAFLMSFDLIKYFIHRSHAKDLPKLIQHLGVTENGVGFKKAF